MCRVFGLYNWIKEELKCFASSENEQEKGAGVINGIETLLDKY